MSTLTVTARGQITLRKEVLQRLGIGPGHKIELAKLLDGRVMLKAARSAGKIDRFLGLRAGKAKRKAHGPGTRTACLRIGANRLFEISRASVHRSGHS